MLTSAQFPLINAPIIGSFLCPVSFKKKHSFSTLLFKRKAFSTKLIKFRGIRRKICETEISIEEIFEFRSGTKEAL